jgi:uncharacterized protein YbjT (DUF2867 family)
VARCLIIGCGCRGLYLTRELRGRSHAIRATTRDPSRTEEIEAAGAEPFVGDPDRIATLGPALAHVGVACILLGSATGEPDALRALHSTRLDMLLERMLDTTVRGVVYERVGSVPPDILADGAQRVGRACERSMIRYMFLSADPAAHEQWLVEASAAVEQILR